VNSIHATFARLVIHRTSPAGMPNPVSLGVNMFNIYPNSTDLSVSSHFSVGGGSNAPAYYTRDQYHFADDMDMIIGRHHPAFGVEFIDFQMNTANVYQGNGEFTFNGSLTNDPLADPPLPASHCRSASMYVYPSLAFNACAGI
jgi:hypothetical protein